MSVSPSSSSSSSSSCSSGSPIDLQQRKCVICDRLAYSNNYGVLSCDACKMFYRRIVILNRDYKCKYGGICRETLAPRDIKCKGCRYQMCLEAGMTFQPTFLELTNEKDMDVAVIIGNILFLDSRRCKAMKTQFTDDDATLGEVLQNRMRMKTRRTDISNHDWSFLGIYTSIEFLMSLEFMSFLIPKDKEILLKAFCVKASLFASAMRAMKENRDRLMTVDGRDVYPDNILKMGCFTAEFLQRIRSLLVNRLIELKLTNEEFALLNALFFCNPAFYGLSAGGLQVITAQQKVYSSALLQYCNVAYERHGPTRFTELLSLFHVINRNFEDVQAMTMIFKLIAPGVVYRKIVREVIVDLNEDEDRK